MKYLILLDRGIVCNLFYTIQDLSSMNVCSVIRYLRLSAKGIKYMNGNNKFFIIVIISQFGKDERTYIYVYKYINLKSL